MEPFFRQLSRTVAADADPLWAQLFAAVSGCAPLLMRDPAWPTAWLQHFQSGIDSLDTSALLPDPAAPGPALLFATSGSSTGLPRLCVHTAATLRAAADAYCQLFAQIPHAVRVLPLAHVGGFMPCVRAAVAGGKIHAADYRQPSSWEAAPFDLREAAISLVPTQLSRLMQLPEVCALLRRFGLILIGGAAAPPALLDAARRAGLRMAPCYGMTETAAMVTVLLPDEFAAGACGVGKPMPHAELVLDASGALQIRSTANLHSYLPPVENLDYRQLATRDRARIDANGYVHIIGRSDRVFISGGENIQPESVEAVALGFRGVIAARCHGEADPDWGMRVVLEVAFDPLANQRPDAASALREFLRHALPPYAVPKDIRTTQRIFTGTMGKGLPQQQNSSSS